MLVARHSARGDRQSRRFDAMRSSAGVSVEAISSHGLLDPACRSRTQEGPFLPCSAVDLMHLDRGGRACWASFVSAPYKSAGCCRHTDDTFARVVLPF